MPDNCQFIDIHTHKINSFENRLSVFNVLPNDNLYELPNDQFFSMGVHPWYLDKWEQKLISLTQKIDNENFIAIGECGLDTFAKYPIAHQEEVFLRQAHLADQFNKPVIIHCVKQYHTLLQLRKAFQVPWILHGFSANIEIAKQCLEKGMYLSFGKLLFTSNSQSIKVAGAIDLEKVFLETDESNYSISDIYNRFAEIRNLTTDNIKCLIAANFKKVFTNKVYAEK